jgi:hypothetical protein
LEAEIALTVSAHSGGSKRFMATRYYIYDRAAHVSEVDRPKWTRWVKKGNSASKHNWVGITQVVTTYPGASKRDFAGMAQALATTLGAGRYVWDPGISVCFVMDLDGDDVEEPQLCNGGLEQGEAMHARTLAIARRRCKERENSGQEAESSNMMAERMMASVRNGKIVPIGFMRSSRPLRHAAFLRSYIGVPKRG